MTQARDLADGKFDTSTLVVDAANNRVGIGTISATGKLDVEDTTGSLSATKDITAEFMRNDGTYGPRLQIRHSTEGSDIHHTYSTGADDITVSIANGEKLRIQSGGGISFNGDTAAANALDDYEEGEFTYGFGVTSGSITARSEYQKGFYTKIGRLVTIQLRFEANSLSSPTGDVYITGFPFASAASTSDRNNSQHYPVMFRELSGVTDFGGGFVTMIANATQARFQYTTHSGGAASIQGGDIQSDFQGTLNFTYVT